MGLGIPTLGKTPTVLPLRLIKLSPPFGETTVSMADGLAALPPEEAGLGVVETGAPPPPEGPGGGAVTDGPLPGIGPVVGGGAGRLLGAAPAA